MPQSFAADSVSNLLQTLAENPKVNGRDIYELDVSQNKLGLMAFEYLKQLLKISTCIRNIILSQCYISKFFPLHFEGCTLLLKFLSDIGYSFW